MRRMRGKPKPFFHCPNRFKSTNEMKDAKIRQVTVHLAVIVREHTFLGQVRPNEH